MRKVTNGFTVIEILVVIGVIGILATISLVSFNRYQVSARDSQRSSKATILTEALEKYYDRNGEYPACPAVTSEAATVTTDVLPGVEQNTLVTPTEATETNSIKCQDLTTDDPDIFAYIGDGSQACTSGNSCLTFTLKYKEEGSNTIKSITGRRQTSIAFSDPITDLTCTTYSFSAINCTWTASDNAASYNIQRATNDTFTTDMAQSTSSTNSASITGLSLSTLYYVRVQPVALGTAGGWSNTASDTTYSLDTPVCTATADSISQISCTWAPVDNATSYNLDYDSSCSFSAPTSFTNTTSPLVLTGLDPGTTRTFRVKALAAGYTSGWSACASATTNVPVPTGLALTVNSTIQITANWSAVDSATSYDVDYSTSSTFSSFTTTNSTTTSKAITGLNQNTTYYVRVRSNIGPHPSANSATVNAKTPAVVLSGPVECAGTYSIGGTGPGYAFEVRTRAQEVSYNLAANTSNVSWVLFRRAIKNGYSSWDQTKTWPWGISVDGQTSSGSSNSSFWRSNPSVIGETETIASGTKTITHNANGTKTIGYSGYDGPGSNIFGYASCSGSYALSDLR